MRAVVFASNGFEDTELLYPYYRLQEAGFEVDVATPDIEEIEGKHGYTMEADLRIKGAEVDDYDLLVLPGGGSPENLRMESPEALEFIREFDAHGDVIAAICHGPQLLISAGVVDGSNMTCYESIKDDLKNAGARYRDEPVVVDGSFVTSRNPGDLPVFMEKTLEKVQDRVE